MCLKNSLKQAQAVWGRHKNGHDEAPSDKARAFIERVATQIRARGEDWMIEHQDALHLRMSAEQLEAIAPVEDNRLWWTAEWQKALMA